MRIDRANIDEQSIGSEVAKDRRVRKREKRKFRKKQLMLSTQ